MRIVHIEDEAAKIRSLAQNLVIDRIVRNEAELADFLETAAQEAGIAILDVVSFWKLLKEDLIKIGEDLADAGWTVIYWSVGVTSEDVREDCWFEDRNDNAGVEAIAAAVNSRNFSAALKCGDKPGEDELVLSLLSALLPVGWLWEREEHVPQGLIKCLETCQTKGMPDFERLLLERFREHVLREDAGFWSIPVDFRRLVKRFDRFIESRWEKIRGNHDFSPTSSDAFPGVERVFAYMAGSGNLREWNENLADLRENLL